MNAMLLRNMTMHRSGSLQSFSDYRASEARNPQQSSVTSDGALLEYETLELRIHPPNVQVRYCIKASGPHVYRILCVTRTIRAHSFKACSSQCTSGSPKLSIMFQDAQSLPL